MLLQRLISYHLFCTWRFILTFSISFLLVLYLNRRDFKITHRLGFIWSFWIDWFFFVKLKKPLEIHLFHIDYVFVKHLFFVFKFFKFSFIFLKLVWSWISQHFGKIYLSYLINLLFGIQNFHSLWSNQVGKYLIKSLVYHYFMLIYKSSQFLILKQLLLKFFLLLDWINFISFFFYNLSWWFLILMLPLFRVTWAKWTWWRTRMRGCVGF